jgi:hypothetical protein
MEEKSSGSFDFALESLDLEKGVAALRSGRQR